MDQETIHNRMAVAAGRLTYRDVAELAGVHPETARRYMTGDMPSPEFLAAFCESLGVSADWLVFGSGPMITADALGAALARVPEQALFAAIAQNFAKPDAPGGGEEPGSVDPDPGDPLRVPPAGSNAPDRGN